MTKLNSDDINKVAKLAKLQLTKDEEERFAKQLSNILSYMDTLQEVSVSEKPKNVTEEDMRLREDEVDTSYTFSSQKATREASIVHNNMFVVDMVLSERSSDK